MSALDDEARATLHRWTRDGWLWIAAGLASFAISGTVIWFIASGARDADKWSDALGIFPWVGVLGLVFGVKRLSSARRTAALLRHAEWSTASVRTRGSVATGGFDFEISESNDHWRPLVLPRSDKKLLHEIRVAERIEIATLPGSSFIVRPPNSRSLCVVGRPSGASRHSITGWPRWAFPIGITVALVLVASLQLGAIDQASEAHRRSVALDQLIYSVGPQDAYRTGERLEDEARKQFIRLTVAAVVLALVALGLTITFVILVRRRPKRARLTPWAHAWTCLVILGCATTFIATCFTSGASPWRDAISGATYPATIAALFALASAPVVWCAPRRVTTTSGL